MAYRLPNFNLTSGIGPNLQAYPPRLTSLSNLAWGNRTSQTYTFGITNATTARMLMTLLLPKGTDIRGPANIGGVVDSVECPIGSGRYYFVLGVDDIGKGFPNEHRAAVLQLYLCPTVLP